MDIPIRDYWEYREGLKGLKKAEEKADYIDSLDLPTSKKNILINNQLNRKEKVDMTGYGDYDSLEEFDFANDNPGKYAVSQAVGGYNSYKSYTDALNKIKADKNANGKTISGSAKNKKIEYINGLNIDYGAKLILFKSEYPSDDTYNYEIINYLNGIESFTYEDRVAILKELGFTITADGNAEWD